MGDEPEVLRGLPLRLEIPVPNVLRDGVGDPGVQELHHHLLIPQADDQSRPSGDLQDALMKRAVFANHFGHVEAQPQALLSMLLGMAAHGRQRHRVRIERAGDLVDEGGDVIESSARGSAAETTVLRKLSLQLAMSSARRAVNTS